MKKIESYRKLNFWVYRKICYCFWLIRYTFWIYISTIEKNFTGVNREILVTSILEKIPVRLPTMNPKITNSRPVNYIFPYSSSTGEVQGLIHNAKFFGSFFAQWTCAKILLNGLINLYEKESFEVVIIVPVPSSPKNVRSRGYDQCLKILSLLDVCVFSKVTESKIYLLPILGKKRFVKEQKKMNLEGRLAKRDNPLFVQKVRPGNFSDEFIKIVQKLWETRAVKGSSPHPRYSICIIDDVVTTGVTIENARMCVRDFLTENFSKSDGAGELEKLIKFQAITIAHEL